jgi:hypothetical protein
MQPYIFPYLGYFQLINAVDKFVIYDDITFIKQGWINRNAILLNNEKHLFTIPLQNVSSNIKINESIVSATPFNWQKKILQTIEVAYKKAPFFSEVYPIVKLVMEASINKSISQMATDSLKIVMDYLSIKTTLIESSNNYLNEHLKSEDRIIDICKTESATSYINAIGGIELYSKENFLENDITLIFLKPNLKSYPQLGKEFLPGLSIIDVLMFNSPKEITEQFLLDYTLI